MTGVAGAVDPRENLVSRLGILGVDVDRGLLEMLPWVRIRAGVIVVSQVDGAIESRDGGLAPGDVVFGVNRTPTPTLGDLRSAVDALKAGDAVVLHVERRGARLYLPFTFE